MDIWSIIGGTFVIAVLIWPIVALSLAGRTSRDIFAIGAGAFALSVGAMEWIGVVFQDPHPSVFIALGCLLIALGLVGPSMRVASGLVALVGFVVAEVTLYRFRGDEYQGTGSLILSLVFGLYLAMRIPAKWRDFVFGPGLIMGGVIDYLRGRWDYGLLVAAGIACTLLTVGRRNARWRERVEIVAPPLKIAALSLGGIGLISGHHELVWPGLFIYWSLRGFAPEPPNHKSPRTSLAPGLNP
jgi:hypothetical protein